VTDGQTVRRSDRIYHS